MKKKRLDINLTTNDQHQAVIPTPLWKLILEVEGWFPVQR